MVADPSLNSVLTGVAKGLAILHLPFRSCSEKNKSEKDSPDRLSNSFPIVPGRDETKIISSLLRPNRAGE